VDTCAECGEQMPVHDGPGRPAIFCGRRCRETASRRATKTYASIGREVMTHGLRSPEFAAEFCRARGIAPSGPGGTFTSADADAAIERLGAPVAASGRVFVHGIRGTGPGGTLTEFEQQTAEWVGEHILGGQVASASTFVTAAGNPLVAKVVSEAPGVFAAALGNGSPPTLFPGGDLPDATDSGVPPSTLMRLPWPARWPAMRLTRPSQVYDMINEYDGMTPADAETAALREYGGDIDNSAYAAAVVKWRLGGMTDAQAADSIFGPDPQGAPAQNSNRFGTG